MPAMASKTCRIWLLAVLMGPNGRFLHSGDESVCACILVSSSKAPVPSSDALVPSSFLLLLVRHLLLLAMHLLLLARFCCFLLLCPYDPNFASPSELSGCGKQLTMRGSSTAQSGALLMYSSLASLGSVPCDSCARSMLALEAAGWVWDAHRPLMPRSSFGREASIWFHDLDVRKSGSVLSGLPGRLVLLCCMRGREPPAKRVGHLCYSNRGNKLGFVAQWFTCDEYLETYL